MSHEIRMEVEVIFQILDVVSSFHAHHLAGACIFRRRYTYIIYSWRDSVDIETHEDIIVERRLPVTIYILTCSCELASA